MGSTRPGIPIPSPLVITAQSASDREPGLRLRIESGACQPQLPQGHRPPTLGACLQCPRSSLELVQHPDMLPRLGIQIGCQGSLWFIPLSFLESQKRSERGSLYRRG